MKRGRVGCQRKRVVYWKLQVLIQVSSMPKVKFLLSSKTKNKRNFFEQVTLHDLNKCWTVNMTWCYEVRGPQYHWVTSLYERSNLPILPAIVKTLSEAVKLRAAELQKQKSNHSKALRVRMKVARAEDQEARKKWVKCQAIIHSYGQDDKGDDELGDVAEVTVISNRTCRCGSASHKRTTHRSCPLNTTK